MNPAVVDTVADRGDRSERRSAPRVSGSWSVQWVRNDGPIELSSVDISARGVFVASESPVDVGETVRLIVSRGGSQPVEVCGAVRWRRDQDSQDAPAGFGVAFDDDSSAKLQRLITSPPTAAVAQRIGVVSEDAEALRLLQSRPELLATGFADFADLLFHVEKNDVDAVIIDGRAEPSRLVARLSRVAQRNPGGAVRMVAVTDGGDLHQDGAPPETWVLDVSDDQHVEADVLQRAVADAFVTSHRSRAD